VKNRLHSHKKTVGLVAILTLICSVGLVSGTPPPKPLISITTPKPGTNGVLTLTGKATETGNVAVTNVFCTLDGNTPVAATNASPITNWTVPNLQLTPGPNTIEAWAVNADGVSSITDTVKIVYVVKTKLTVNTNGSGTVNPKNGTLLQIGNPCILTATAVPGFKFVGWTGSETTNTATIKITVESNMSYTANFIDDKPPVCVVVHPGVNAKLTNSPITATIGAKDNVGVAAVYYELNAEGWQTNATTADGKNWTTPELTLTVGANTLAAFATDAAGNISPTNTVKFTYTVPPFTGFAPVSPTGLVGQAVMQGETNSFEISFGESTFANFSSDTNGDSKVGNYTWTLLDSNTVQLVTSAIWPPWEASGIRSTTLTFTNTNNCVFTNDMGSNGAITFQPSAFTVPSPSSIMTIESWDTNNNSTNLTMMGMGMFTNYSGTSTNWGTYSLMSFSPTVALMQMNYTDPQDAGSTNYSEMDFSSSTAGAWFTAQFDSSGNQTFVGVGGYECVAITNPPAGNAPMNLVGTMFAVTPKGQPSFTACFGPDAMSTDQLGTTNSNQNGVADYSYIKTGTDTAQLVNWNLPPSQGGNNGVIYLTFTSPTSATFESPGGGGGATGTVSSIGKAIPYAPVSIAGSTVHPSTGGTATFGVGGVFQFAKGNESDMGTYTYAQYSPIGGMIFITHGDGSTSYIQLTFRSNSGTAFGGDYFETDFDSSGNNNGTSDGTFSAEK
jgi:uncharacterized repeat protein (TIGR02543 family)